MSARWMLKIGVLALCACGGPYAPPLADPEPPEETDTPAATEEVCGDGVDNDLDGAVDDDGVGAVEGWVDDDGDGYGDPARPRSACPGVAGVVARGDDCDDRDPEVHPGAVDPPYDGVDAACDGGDEFDADGDGARWVPGAPWEGDCDDGDPAVHPGAPEVWYDGVDQDCDPATEWDADGDGRTWTGALVGRADDCDDADPEVGGPSTWYRDADGDGWGDEAAPRVSCRPMMGYAPSPGDCDDAAADAWPGGPERPYDGVDGDCDGADDFDADGDGWRGAGGPDCDDGDPAVHPAAAEVWYDGRDQDCDAANDFDADRDGVLVFHDCDDADPRVGVAPAWPMDADGDGVAGDQIYVACARPARASTVLGDCDDADPAAFPGAPEVWYDGIDQACDGGDDFDADGDGLARALDCDDGDPGVGRASPWPVDADGDGVAGPQTVAACARPANAADALGDCDDGDATAYPGAPEVWYDGIDQACDGGDDFDADADGLVRALDCDDGDPGVGRASTWPVDADGDGVAGPQTVAACARPANAADALGDCDDGDALAYPGAPEVWYDGIDQACDGGDDFDADGDGLVWALDCDDADPAVAAARTWTMDADGDGFAGTRTVEACERPARASAVLGDCDDADPAAFPGAPERWYDGIDQACDGGDDFDADGDGQGSARHRRGPDCDDADPTVHVGAREVWYDGIDQACDGGSDFDRDGDGLPASLTPDGGSDCDDRRADIGAASVWWPDQDRDGFGVGDGEWSCVPRVGFVERGGDCDDGRPGVNPAAVEACNLVDDDCDGAVDDGVGVAWWPDADGDGFGDGDALPVVACRRQGWVDRGGDCDDADADTWPGAPEQCDARDNDCAAGTPVDTSAACGPGTQHTVWLGTHYLSNVLDQLDRDAAGRWCAARGYHLAWFTDVLSEVLVRRALRMETVEHWIGGRTECGPLPWTVWAWYDEQTGRCTPIDEDLVLDHDVLLPRDTDYHLRGDGLAAVPYYGGAPRWRAMNVTATLPVVCSR